MEKMDARQFKKIFNFNAKLVFKPENLVDANLVADLEKTKDGRMKTNEFGHLTDAEEVTRYYMLEMYWLLVDKGEVTARVSCTIGTITLFFDKAEYDTMLETVKSNNGMAYPPLRKN